MTKVRDIAPFGLRMHPDLRARLTAEMHRAGRSSLNEEICVRLKASLERPVLYALHEPAPGAAYNESCNGTVYLSQEEREFVEEIKRLSLAKRAALLTLLKN
jgi:hypothetical protein